MSISTTINIVLSTLSFILAFISIIFVIITLRQNKALLKQNNRMLEESTRPYITIYLDSITLCEQASYFVVKNFGNSPALITKFEYDPLLKQTEQKSISFQKQFDFIENIVLAPNQSKLLEYDVTKLPTDIITFQISYLHGKIEYHETITMNVKNYIHIPVARPSSHTTPENQRQVHTLRELLERSI